MAFTVIFLLSTALILTNVEPLRLSGIFLSICYLPGFYMSALLKKNKLFFEDLILAMPYSIGMSSVVTLVALFFGVHIKYVSYGIHVANGIAAVSCFIREKRNGERAYLEIRKEELSFCIIAVFIIAVLSLPFFFGLNKMGIAGHAFHHSLLMTQILHGIFPPENPGLGATAIGYYWGFHAFISAITANTNFHPLQITFVINMLSLLLIVAVSYSFAKSFNMKRTYCFIFPLAVIGLMRVDAGILFLLKLILGKLASLRALYSPLLEPYDVLESWLRELPRLDTRLLFLRKFYNISGMPLAVSLCYSYLLILRLALKGNAAKGKIYMIGQGFVIIACFLNYPPLAIFLLLHGPVWSFYIFLSTRGSVNEKIREAMKIAGPYIGAGLLVSPYMFFIMMSRDISSSNQGGIFHFAFYFQSIINAVAFLLPLPAILAGVWLSVRRLSLSREMMFLLIGTSLCIFLSVFTKWPFDNSYKYDYVLSFFFAFFFVYAVSIWQERIAVRWMKYFVTACTIIVLSLTPFIVEASYLVASYLTEYKYAFSNGHIFFTRDKTKNEAYQWIRENTPGNALLMLSYSETDWPCCGFNTNYESAAIAERTLFVIKDEDYTASNPEYERRLIFKERLFENPEDPRVVDFFISLKRQVYLLVEDNLPEKKFIVEDRFKNFPVNPGKPFTLVFQNKSQRVYRIDIHK